MTETRKAKRDVLEMMEIDPSHALAAEMREALQALIELHEWQRKAHGAMHMGRLDLVERFWPGITTSETMEYPEAFMKLYDASMRLFAKLEEISQNSEK